MRNLLGGSTGGRGGSAPRRCDRLGTKYISGGSDRPWQGLRHLGTAARGGVSRPPAPRKVGMPLSAETPAPAADAGSAAGSATTPATDAAPTNPPATTGTDGTAAGATSDPNAKPADNATTDTKKESTSKKKKGLKKIIPW